MSLTTNLIERLNTLIFYLDKEQEWEACDLIQEAISHIRNLDSDLRDSRAAISTFQSILKEAQRG